MDVSGLQGCIEDPARVPGLGADQETEVRENRTKKRAECGPVRLSELDVTLHFRPCNLRPLWRFFTFQATLDVKSGKSARREDPTR